MTETNNYYDYIIVGAGAAGLMLATAMAQDSFFDHSKILVLDKDPKNVNDRTWCFWEKGDGQFDHIVSYEWSQINFTGKQFSKDYNINPYTYKMVKGLDFYKDSITLLSSKENIHFKIEEVVQIIEKEDGAVINTLNCQYESKQVFNSIFSYEQAKKQSKYPVLEQHFLGWHIRTNQSVFNPKRATYMDFSIPQKGNTRFMYVLPFSEREALIEYTLFSQNKLPEKEYSDALEVYLKENLGLESYTIVEKEYGSIPMTCYDFSINNSRHIFNIGTAGGWAKPSTGYAFMSTATMIPKLVHHLKANTPLSNLNHKNRFWYYDLLLLDVLAQKNYLGHYLFQSIFEKRDPQLLFKFLSEKTSFQEEIYLIFSCPKYQFIRTLIKRIAY
ncbi:MAG: lycopene cyclase [Pseudozobellia sp.]|nr:lycopene cyclase [Pseudozobellia sp.]|tara:strand:- start:981 stop:2138 length:1158 start_codon:yes stop_codon:yes gene_type:complete